MKKNRLLSLLLALSVLGLPGCREKEMTEEERLAAISEMGERGREYHAKRKKFLESNLYAEGIKYLEDILAELVPGGTAEITIEPGNWINETEEALAASLDTEEKRIEFYYRAQVYIYINFWDFDIDARTLALELVARQISGSLYADEYISAEWWMNGREGKVDYYVYPGY